MNSFHLLEASKWMTFRNQFRNGPLVQGPSDEKNDVVNHVAVSKIQTPDRGLTPSTMLSTSNTKNPAVRKNVSSRYVIQEC